MDIFELHQSPLNTDLCIKIYNFQILTFVDHPAVLILFLETVLSFAECSVPSIIVSSSYKWMVTSMFSQQFVNCRSGDQNFAPLRFTFFQYVALWKNLSEAIFLLKLEILIMHSKVVLCILYLFRYKGWIQHDLQSHKRPNPEWKWKSV